MVGGLMASGIAVAQDTSSDGTISKILTVDEAIAMAKQNYPSLKESQAFIERERAMKGTSFDLGNTSFYTGREDQGVQQGALRTYGLQQGNIDLLSGFSKSK